MSAIRKSLYERMPEIYRIKDEEQVPPQQLKAYLDILDQTQSALHDNIESLYHDLFIETCHDWVIPYLADLLGASHLSGDPWTLRADIARTVKHRRRKGTLGSIESLTYGLTRWAVHTVELRDRVVWSQHLNHQRPDRNGEPPLPLQIEESGYIGGAAQGGLVNLRDPALLSFLGGAFDPFARIVDVRPHSTGAIRNNLPNLAIFLWRLAQYALPVVQPSFAKNERFKALPEPLVAGNAEFVVGFNLHPLGEPMVIFNTHRYQADADPPNLTSMDSVPGPMPTARLSEDSPSGNPDAYVELEYYSSTADLPTELTDDRVGLTLYLPDSLSGASWSFRGANLCAWQDGLNPPLREYEMAIDPVHGRILFGVTDEAIEADVIADGLYASISYGHPGPTGAHPIARSSSSGDTIQVDYENIVDESGTSSSAPGGLGLQQALDDIHLRTSPLTIEIQDSRTYDLNLNAVSGIDSELGLDVLRLLSSLTIRAASGQRPIIRLHRPLAFRPEDVSDPGVSELDVTLEGLYITWGQSSAEFLSATPLIARAALNQLSIKACTLDPGSHQALDGTRQDSRYGFHLENDFGFDPALGEDFDQIPVITLHRSVCGPIAMDDSYELVIEDSIIDAASGVSNDSPDLAVHAASGSKETEWGPALSVSGMTCFGRMRVESAEGEGGIWVHRLEVHDDQIGCIKFSYFSGDADRLPQHQACIDGTQYCLSFASEIFGEASYGQIRLRSDSKILEQGPNNDVMGCYGYLLNTHKWKNINIRYREFMPVGTRPVLVPVT